MLRGPFSGSNPNQPLRLSVLWHKKAAEAFLRVNFHLNDREPNHLLHCATTATECHALKDVVQSSTISYRLRPASSAVCLKKK